MFFALARRLCRSRAGVDARLPHLGFGPRRRPRRDFWRFFSVSGFAWLAADTPDERARTGFPLSTRPIGAKRRRLRGFSHAVQSRERNTATPHQPSRTL